MSRIQRNKRERGQSAVEFAVLVPIFLILFAIIYQLFGISYNAQYVHIRSRSKVMKQIGDQPCGAAAKSDDAQVNQGLTFTSSGGPGQVQLKKTSVVKCN